MVVVQRHGPRFLLHLNSLSAAHALPELPRTVRTWLMGEWLARNGLMEHPEVSLSPRPFILSVVYHT